MSKEVYDITPPDLDPEELLDLEERNNLVRIVHDIETGAVDEMVGHQKKRSGLYLGGLLVASGAVVMLGEPGIKQLPFAVAQSVFAVQLYKSIKTSRLLNRINKVPELVENAGLLEAYSSENEGDPINEQPIEEIARLTIAYEDLTE